jgi:SNF2 family DNA or RNA helicase
MVAGYRRRDHAAPLVFSPKPIWISEENTTSEIQLSADGTMEIKFKSDDLTFSGIPAAVLTWIEACQAGLGVFCPSETEELIEIRKTSKRASDLKLLRHAGVAAYVIQEVLRTLLRQKSLTPDQQYRLDQKVLDLLMKLDGTPSDVARSLDHFCSKAALEIYRESIKKITDSFWEESALTWDGTKFYFLKGAHRLSAQWMLAWLQGQAKHQGAQFLFRSRDAFVDAETAGTFELHPGLGLGSRSFRLLTKKQFNVDRLLRAFTALPEHEFEIYLDGARVEELSDTDFKSEFVLQEHEQSTGKIDWFELNPKFFLKGTEITEDQAKSLSQQGMIRFEGKVYRLPAQALPSLEQLAKFWDQIAMIELSKKRSKTSDRVYPLPRHASLELLLLRKSGVEIQGGKHWKAVCEFFDNLDKERPLPGIPKTFKGELKHYQLSGLQWINDIYQLGLGGILADDMGLGKTVQTLAFLEELRLKNDLGQSMIVVPTSLTYNWLTEAKRFTPDLSIHLFQSREIDKAHVYLRDNPQGLLITTYGLLAEHIQFFSQYKWNIHIYDEAQNLKTITAKRTTASRQLAAQFKLCLTGTPLENHLGEFYSLVDLVVPGSLGALDKFRKTYLTSYAPEPERVQYLRMKTRPLVLRRTKSAILKELPAKMESAVRIPFSEKQLKIYRDIALSWNSKVRENIQKEGTAKSQIIMLTALLRLRQACSAPSAIPNVKYDETPPKISLLIDTLTEIVDSGESALVFTQFMGTFSLIEKGLKAAGIPYFYMHGKVARKERDEQIRQFQEFPKGAVMLMTLKTGGVGLNLVKASYVFHLEPWWNPAVENQATDRTHRIGQTRSVQVYRYIMSDSVEEKIELLKERKSAQFNALFSDAEGEMDLSAASGSGGSLSQSDFEYLLGITDKP